jgi:hypothetical protein
MGAAVAAVCLLSVAAFAADLSGTWTFAESADAGGRKGTLILDLNEGQLSGSFRAPGQRGRSVKITAASISGDTLRFTVRRTVQGARVVAKYSGKFKGDTITGKVEGPPGSDGQSGSRDWIARRSLPASSSGK